MPSCYCCYCRRQNHYGPIADVTDTRCVSCRTPISVYKCFSCMKLSAHPRGALRGRCPHCFTMTRGSGAGLPWVPFRMPVHAVRSGASHVSTLVPATLAPPRLMGMPGGGPTGMGASTSTSTSSGAASSSSSGGALSVVPVPVVRISLLHAAGLMRNTAVSARPGLSVLAAGQDVTGCSRLLIGINGRDVTHVGVHEQASCAFGHYLLSDSFMSCIPVVGVSAVTRRTYLAHVQAPFGYKELFGGWDPAVRIMIVRKETPPNHVRNVGLLEGFLKGMFPGAVEVVDTGFNLSNMGVVVCNSTCLTYRTS